MEDYTMYKQLIPIWYTNTKHHHQLQNFQRKLCFKCFHSTHIDLERDPLARMKSTSNLSQMEREQEPQVNQTF